MRSVRWAAGGRQALLVVYHHHACMPTELYANMFKLLSASPPVTTLSRLSVLSDLQVTPCPKRYTHDWVDCPFAHAGERAARRDPWRHRIAGVSCVEFKQVRCVLLPPCCAAPASAAAASTLPPPPCCAAPTLPPPTHTPAPPPQKGKCAQGDACPHAHNGWELWLSEER